MTDTEKNPKRTLISCRLYKDADEFTNLIRFRDDLDRKGMLAVIDRMIQGLEELETAIEEGKELPQAK